MTIKTIMCPIDLSERSLIALVAAGEIALHSGAELYVLHVIRPAHVQGPYGPRGDEVRRMIRAVVPMLVNRETPVHTLVTAGDAADEIVQLSRDVGAHLIVMATGPDSGWIRFRDGSVADEVAGRSYCPVLALQVTLEQVRAFGGDRSPTWSVSLN